LPEKQERNGDTSRVPQNSDNKWAAGLAFDSADHIEAALKAAREEAKKYTEYPGSTEAFDLLIPHVPLNRRCAFLSGLAEMLGSNNYYFSAEHLHKAIELWRSDPGVQQWCREELPATVQDRLIRLGAWARYGQSPLTNLIADTQLPNSEVCNLFVAGLAQNADDLSADVALPLVSLIATHLTAPQAHSLASWYSERVSSRIPTKEKDVVDISDMPDSVQLAIGRFLFAVMSDVDVRIRWLAAHAVRRLAKLSEEDVMRRLDGVNTDGSRKGFTGRLTRLSIGWPLGCGFSSPSTEYQENYAAWGGSRSPTISSRVALDDSSAALVDPGICKECP
jgi:hypothetical protein